MQNAHEKYLEFFVKNDLFGRAQGYVPQFLEDGSVTYEMMVTSSHQSSPGYCHGGAITALLDASLGSAALYHAFLNESLCSTVELRTSFIQQALVGETLVAKARLVQKGKKIVYAEGEITEKLSGRLIAKAYGTFNLYPLDKKEFMKGTI
jgi:acyl-CoA thioesterase